MACGSESRFPLPSFMPDNFSLATLYKDAPESVSGRRRNPREPQLVGLDMGARFAQP